MIFTFLHILDSQDLPSGLFELERLHKYLILMLTCTVKYLVGMIYAKADGLNFYETLTFGALGGILGVIVFSYFGAFLRRYSKGLRKYFQLKHNYSRAKRLMTFWHKYGIIGMAFISPFVSPMIAVIVALAFREKPLNIIRYYCTALVLWTVIFSLIFELF